MPYAFAANQLIPLFNLCIQVPDQLKTNYADECYNPDGIVPRAVSMIKTRFPDSIVCTDVALDPYSDQGHDGVVKDGKILNDETIMQLTKQVRCAALRRVVPRCAMLSGAMRHDSPFVFV